MIRRKPPLSSPHHIGVKSVNIDHIYMALFLSLIVSLCYKIFPLGIISLIGLATAGWVYRAKITKINLPMILGLLYVADASVTAFLVSPSAGMLRSAQFTFIAAGLIGIFFYSFRIDKERISNFTKCLFILTILIFLHLIVYHLLNGRYVTWKYLYDTKIVISLSVFLCFTLKDWIQRYVNFYSILMVLFLLVLFSAERKALLLFAVAWVFSTVSWKIKALIGLAAPILLGVVAVSGFDDGYIAKKFNTASGDLEQVSDRYFMTVEDIGDRSDVIRAFVNRNAWNLFKDHPWFGIGATGYQSWARDTYGAYEGMAMNVHGEVHRVPVEGGVIGILISCFYLLVVLWRSAFFAFIRPDRNGSSIERGPLLLVLYVMCYAYAEAFDTAMLVLIGMVGVVAARLPSPSLSSLIGRKRSSLYRPAGGRFRARQR